MAKRQDKPKGERQKQLEQDPVFGEATGDMTAGRAGGNLARDVGTRDTLKRAFERPAGKTRVRKQDEEGGGE